MSMFGQGAITKRMTAIEEMAGMDMLCSDKTGTLTLNRLTVDKNMIEIKWTVLFPFFQLYIMLFIVQVTILLTIVDVIAAFRHWCQQGYGRPYGCKGIKVREPRCY